MVEATKSECESYIILKRLGSGSFGVVKKAQEKLTKSLAALKILVLTDYSEEFAKEASILQLLKHQNIIEIFKVVPKAKYIKKKGSVLERDIIVMELAEGGCLYDYLFAAVKLHKRGFTEPTIRRLFHQMVDALEYCHKAKVAHRDLKPENILLDAEFNIKLADFGLATIADKQKHLTIAGSDGYQAPEVLLEKGYDLEPADIFVLGVMLFMMKAGHPPFEQASPEDSLYKWIFSDKLEKFWKGHIITKQAKFGKDFYSQDFQTLCSSLLQPKPELRCKFEDIRASKWYNGEVADKETLTKELKGYIEEVNAIQEKEREERRPEKIGTPKMNLDGKETTTFEVMQIYRGDAVDTVKDELRQREIILEDKKREIATKIGGKTRTSYEIVSENMSLLFSCMVLAAAAVCEKVPFEVSDKKYKVVGKFSLQAGKLDTESEDKSIEDQVEGKLAVSLYKISERDNEYIISFEKLEGNYFRFLQFVEKLFMPEFKKLPW